MYIIFWRALALNGADTSRPARCKTKNEDFFWYSKKISFCFASGRMTTATYKYYSKDNIKNQLFYLKLIIV